MGFALISPLAIGYRHILPVLPFVIVWVAERRGCCCRTAKRNSGGATRGVMRGPNRVAGSRHAGDLSASPVVLQ